jgi:hypothetical protein
MTKDEARDALLIAIAKWAMSDLDIPGRIRIEVQNWLVPSSFPFLGLCRWVEGRTIP